MEETSWFRAVHCRANSSASNTAPMGLLFVADGCRDDDDDEYMVDCDDGALYADVLIVAVVDWPGLSSRVSRFRCDHSAARSAYGSARKGGCAVGLDPIGVVAEVVLVVVTRNDDVDDSVPQETRSVKDACFMVR